MKEIAVSVTQRGQITLPAEIRRRWGLRAHDKVLFEIEDDEVKVKRPRRTLAELYGSVKPLRSPEDLEAVSRKAKADKARRTVEEMRRD